MGLPAFSSELEGMNAGAIGASGKHKDYDVGALEALSQEQSPSPQGAASQGAVGDPAPAGKAPSADGALDQEAPQDMLSIFNKASPEDRDYLTNQQQEALAPHGKSLEGGLEEVLMNGGPQAMARAAQFGIDLTDFANKINPAPKGGGPEAKVGQAFGNVPTEEQSASGEAFKSQEQAVGDMRAGLKKNKDEAVAKKKAQRDAIAAFLMETGLRVLASTREDVGGAFGEAALGTMESGAARKRQAAQDKMAADENERKNKRQDAADEAARVREARDAEQYEYDKSQRGVKEAEAERKGLAQIVAKDGTVHYVNIEEGTVEDEDGVPIRKATTEDLSAAQRATDARAKERQVISERNRIRKAVAEGYTDNPELQAIMDEKDPAKAREMINALADKNLTIEGSEDNVTDYDSLDW